MSRVTPTPFDPGSERPMPPRPSTLYSQDGYLNGELMKLETDLQAHAEEVARRSGSTEAREGDLAALRLEAEAAAERFRTVPWDPAKNPADALRDAEFQDHRSRREALRQRLDYAAAAVRDRARERAVVEAPGGREELFWLVAVLGVAGVGFSVGSSLHDAVFAPLFEDSTRALAASFLVGLVLAAVSVLGMLFSSLHAQEKGSGESRGWVALGVLFGFAVYLLRAWLAQTPYDQLIAVGFAGIELVSVLAVKLYSVSLHRAVLDHRRVQAGRAAADAQVGVAQTELEAAQVALAEVERKIEAHLRDVELREQRHRLTDQVRKAAVGAVEVGYRRGIAANRGQAYDADVRVPQARVPGATT